MFWKKHLFDNISVSDSDVTIDNWTFNVDRVLVHAGMQIEVGDLFCFSLVLFFTLSFSFIFLYKSTKVPVPS